MATIASRQLRCLSPSGHHPSQRDAAPSAASLPFCSMDPNDYKWGQVDPSAQQALFHQFAACAAQMAFMMFNGFGCFPMGPPPLLPSNIPPPPWLLPMAMMPAGEIAVVMTTTANRKMSIPSIRAPTSPSPLLLNNPFFQS